MALALVLPAKALVPGAWEQFATETNADAWTVFGYAYDPLGMQWESDFFFPGWTDDRDPFIGFTMSWDNTYIFADDEVAEGAFVGDYAAADVQWITMDVAVSNTALVAYFDVAILSDVGGVERYYYTDSFTVDSFQNNVWEPLVISMEDTWYWWDPTLGQDGQVVGGWVPVTLSASILSNITELGITFFHADQSGTGVDVMIDNVALNHPLVEPDLKVSNESGAAVFSFPRLPAHIYTFEQFNLATEEWAPVSGEDGTFGPDPVSFSPTGGGAGLFRAVAEPYYTPVVTPPAS